MGLESDGTVHQGKLIMRHRRNSEGEVEPLKGAAGSASPRPPNGAKGAGGRGRRNSVGADAEKLSEEMEMARQEVERTAGEALVHESSAMLHRGQAARDSVMAQKQQEAAMIRQQMEEQRKELIQKEKEEDACGWADLRWAWFRQCGRAGFARKGCDSPAWRGQPLLDAAEAQVGPGNRMGQASAG
mmetsp:Transcript_25367/g.61074  ORF Transcript_25367/g.61074 Transcript_25367/m.61074 type:complete len:186 (-) Transcript_25367:1349-1906(-)